MREGMGERMAAGIWKFLLCTKLKQRFEAKGSGSKSSVTDVRDGVNGWKGVLKVRAPLISKPIPRQPGEKCSIAFVAPAGFSRLCVAVWGLNSRWSSSDSIFCEALRRDQFPR